MANISKIPTVSEGNEAPELNRREFGKLALVGLAATIVASKAEHVLADEINPTLASAEKIKRKHGEAIDLGKKEFVMGMKNDPELEGFTEDDIVTYRDEILMPFLNGKDDGTLGEFAKYAPAFTEYVLAFADDFPLSGELKKEVSIARENKKQGELQKQIDALKELQRKLGGEQA